MVEAPATRAERGGGRAALTGTGAVVYCKRHPSVESNLRCSRCDDLICPRCLVHTPVGARCSDCAKVRMNPAFDLRGTALLRGALGAAGAGAAAWGAYLFFLWWIGPLGFLLWLLAPLAIGWGVAEAAFRSAGYRRHRRLMWIAAGGVVVGFAVAFVVVRAVSPGGALPANALEAIGRSLLGILIAAAMAAYRLRI